MVKNASTPPVRVVVANTTFTTGPGTVVGAGDLFDAAYPLVVANPQLFTPAEDLATKHSG